MCAGLDANQFVFPAPQTDLLGVFQAGAPLGLRGGVGEVIVVVVEAGVGQMVGQLAVGHGGSSQTGVYAGLVQRQGIKGGKHPQVGQDGGVILTMAVAVGRNIHHQRDVEGGTAVHHGFGLLSHAAVEDFVGVVVVNGDRV